MNSSDLTELFSAAGELVPPHQIDRTLHLWQSRSERQLGISDGREIATNITHFFEILNEWDAKEPMRKKRQRGQPSNDSAQLEIASSEGGE